MKKLDQIRITNAQNLVESLEASGDKKLTALVRSGLFDPNKLAMLKRALNKDNTKLSKIEKDTLIDLLDKLLNVVIDNQSIFTKVRQTVSESSELMESDILTEKSNIDITQIPPLIVMKRRAIRVFPDGQKVALYWADRINKYISVPFQSIGLSEDFNLQEVSKSRAINAYAERSKRNAEKDDDDADLEIGDYKEKKTGARIIKKYGLTAGLQAKARAKKLSHDVMKKKEYDSNNSWKEVGNRARQGDLAVAAGGALGKLVKMGIDKYKKRSSVNENLDESISNIEKLRLISESQSSDSISFQDGSTHTVTPFIATKLIETYSQINSHNQEIFNGMATKDKDSFMKLIKFSVKK